MNSNYLFSNKIERLQKENANYLNKIQNTRKKDISIKVLGIGGYGKNFIDQMLQYKCADLEMIKINTDIDALINSDKNSLRFLIGKETTKCLGAGGNPETGHQAIQEDTKLIENVLKGSNLVFILTGGGGGSSTDVLPEILRLSKRLNIFIIIIITKPFQFEGTRRNMVFQKCITALKNEEIPFAVLDNNSLFSSAKPKTSIKENLKYGNEIIIQAIFDLIGIIDTYHSPINIDLTDIILFFQNKGEFIIGSACCEGKDKAQKAVKSLLTSPLFNKDLATKVKSIFLIISGDKFLNLEDISDLSGTIGKATNIKANIILGVVEDNNLKDKIRVVLYANKFNLK